MNTLITNTKKTSIILLLLLFIPFAFAQKNSSPKWLKAQLKPGEVISSATSIEGAKRNCIEALITQFTEADNEDPGLYSKMSSGYNLELNPIRSLVDIAMNSSFFKIANKYMPAGQDSVWVMVKVLPKDFQVFNDSLYQASVEVAVDHLVRARELRDAGDIFNASFEYCKAIDAVTPITYFNIDTDEGDLAEVLLKEYPTLYDGISFKFDRNECPMFQGEDIPINIFLNAYKGNLPLVKIPVKIWMRQNDAIIEADNTTDKNGSAKIHVKKAPKAAKANLLAAVDMDKILELPENYATPLLKKHLNDSLKQFSIPLVAVDPTPFYYFEIDTIDSLQVCPLLRPMFNEKGLNYKEVNQKENADVLVKLSYEYTEGEVVKAGNFKIREDKCGVKLSIIDAGTNEILFSHSLNDFAIKSPETRTAEKVRIRAMREMARPLVLECIPLINDVKFDKRKKVYNL